MLLSAVVLHLSAFTPNPVLLAPVVLVKSEYLPIAVLSVAVVLAFKEKYPTLESRISQKHIASYLGISPEFLSKLKSERQKKKS